MKVSEYGGGLVSCACWDEHTTLKWQKCGFFMALLCSFVGAGLVLPYLTVIIRSIMPAFLPLISQAGGAPPTNGIFAIFAMIGSFFGIFAFSLIFESIKHRNYKNLKVIRVCNKVCFVVIIISCVGFILTVCHPVGYTDVPNKFQWVVTVLYEHSVGATMILAGQAIFQYFLTVIWWYLPDTSKTEKAIKISFITVYSMFFLLTLYPLPKYILEELGPKPFDLESMKKISYDLPIIYSTSYIICAICEWSLCLLTIANLMTLFKDLQKVSFRIVIRHKSCIAETMEPTPSIPMTVIS